MVDLDACIAGVRELVVVVDEEGTVRYQSPSVGRVLGYGDVLENDGGGLVGESYLEYVHPEDREPVEAALRASVRGADGHGDFDGNVYCGLDPVHYRVRHADGSWVHLEADGAFGREPETGGYVVVSSDVTERVALERDLERFEVILESIDDGVYAIEEGGEIVYVNESYASMKGVDRDELLGTQIYDWGSGDAGERIRQARKQMEDAGLDAGIVEFDFSTIDGGSIPVEMRFNTVTHPGNELERTGVMRDVTERKARERALRRKNERLEEFASIVSHDLRNPLNVAEARLRQVQREYDIDGLDRVSAAHARMDALIGDLLTLAREGETVSETTVVDLTFAVERSWEGVETADAALAVDTERAICADDSRFRQLLENLIRNAVEHGGRDVTVTVGDVDGGFYFEDDGPGIPAESRERVFEAGYTTTGEGTGFGLGIVQQVAEAHGWEVTATEGSEGGARFVFTGVEFADD